MCSQCHEGVRVLRAVAIELNDVQICVVILGGARIPAGTRSMCRDLGCFGCPMLLGLGGCVDGVCQNHDGDVVIAIGISGKKKEMPMEATCSACGVSAALLHTATIAAAAAEPVGRGCCCVFGSRSDMFEWGNCQFFKI